jgi:hypothetical protein
VVANLTNNNDEYVAGDAEGLKKRRVLGVQDSLVWVSACESLGIGLAVDVVPENAVVV